MAERVLIFDTTLRDGEQSPGCSMTVREKRRMAATLVDLGVDIIEAGFPIASDGDFESVRIIAGETRGVTVAGLARACPTDITRAAAALEGAARPRIHTFIATSDNHLKYKLQKTRAQVLDDAVAAVRLARRYVDDVEFSAEDAARTDIEYLSEVARAVVDAGASTVNIPDTVGYCTPDEFGGIVARIVAEIGPRRPSACTATTTSASRWPTRSRPSRPGARQVECTINGIGERAGNCALEEIVMILEVRRDRLPHRTGINTRQLFPASQLLSSLIAFGPQPNKSIVGRNAFAHEAGIHQDGFLKERTTYEIIDPASVGVPESRLILGKHSGRHALRARLEQSGFALTAEQIDAVYRRFIALADRKKGVTDEEIAAIASEYPARPLPADRMDLRILVLPGDGIGPEVTAEAVAVLHRVADVFGHSTHVSDGLIGGAAIDAAGSPLPPDTRQAALDADAVLLGAVGAPAFDNLPPDRRPERGLLELRQALGTFANLRPSRAWPALLDASPLKNAIVEGTDLLIVRELTSGLYYGTPRGISGAGKDERAVNTLSYTRAEIERVARVAFELARTRRAPRDQRGQVERPRELAALAPRGHRGVARVPGRRARSPPGRQLRDAAGRQPPSVRRRAHREPLRRHPERRSRRAERVDRHARVGVDRRAAHVRPAAPDCTSRCTAPPPTSPVGTSPTRWAPSARSPRCSPTRSVSTRRRAPSRPPSTGSSRPGTLTADLKPAGRAASTTEVGQAVREAIRGADA